jgi:hypothetical protein
MNNIGVEIAKSPLTLDSEIRFNVNIGERNLFYVEMLGDLNVMSASVKKTLYKQKYQEFLSQLEDIKEEELSKLDDRHYEYR